MSRVAVAKLADLAPDTPLAVDVDDELSVAVVLHDGKVYAIEDSCSHGHVPLSEGDVMGGTIECYLHGAAFDLATGVPLCLPATEPVRVFDCHVDGEDVLIDPATPTNH